MLTQAEKLLFILESREDWLLKDKSCLTGENDSIIYDIGDWSVPSADLTILHPAFSLVVQEIFKKYLDDDDERLTMCGDYIYEGYRILVNGTIDIVDNSIQRFHFAEIHDITEVSKSPDCLCVTGLAVVVRHVEFEGKTVPVLYTFYDCTHGFPRTHVDTHYPDWQKRWDVANALGLSGRDRSDYAFMSIPRPSADIAEISFE